MGGITPLSVVHTGLYFTMVQALKQWFTSLVESKSAQADVDYNAHGKQICHQEWTSKKRVMVWSRKCYNTSAVIKWSFIVTSFGLSFMLFRLVSLQDNLACHATYTRTPSDLTYPRESKAAIGQLM